MRILTLLQSDTLQVASEVDTGGILWGIGIIAFIILTIWSYFSLKKDIAKAEDKKRYDEYMEKVNRISELERLKDNKLPYFKIKGVTSYDDKRPGCYVCRIIAEPENPYDSFAVKIEHPTLGIFGHLPKGNTYIHELAKKKELTAAVEMGIYRGTPFGRLYIDPGVFTAEDIAHMEDIVIAKK